MPNFFFKSIYKYRRYEVTNIKIYRRIENFLLFLKSVKNKDVGSHYRYCIVLIASPLKITSNISPATTMFIWTGALLIYKHWNVLRIILYTSKLLSVCNLDRHSTSPSMCTLPHCHLTNIRWNHGRMLVYNRIKNNARPAFVFVFGMDIHLLILKVLFSLILIKKKKKTRRLSMKITYKLKSLKGKHVTNISCGRLGIYF